MLPTYNKSFIFKENNRQNNNICHEMLTNMFTIIVSFRSSNSKEVISSNGKSI